MLSEDLDYSVDLDYKDLDYEKAIKLEEAYALIPPDLYDHLTKNMARILGHREIQVLVYLVAHKRNGRLGIEGASNIIKLCYDTLPGDPKQKERWRKIKFNRHPGKKVLDILRKRLTDYRATVLGANVLITMGEAGRFDIEIFRKKNGDWVSEETGLPEISAPGEPPPPLVATDPLLPAEKNDVLQTFTSPAEAGLLQKVEQCQGNIKISVTGFAIMGRWSTALTQALRGGAKVEILLSHPECDFVKLRGVAIESNLAAMILANRQKLRDVRQVIQQEIERERQQGIQRDPEKLGNLTVRLTSDLISTNYCQLDGQIYFGVFWSRGSSLDGPFFSVRNGSATGTFLERQYDEIWNSAYADDLLENLPRPIPDDKRFHAVIPPEAKT